eukprot:TRINITY_DN17801_c0_g1_i2.p1 TRINITY_DN17801_c0_g1~~TRINITY_DN17801_c0_g1_i2.p1  ORF type:complete len:1397 (+),score=353.99 TRINITY_DN17801_c0_g1_i2:178-4368(+)
MPAASPEAAAPRSATMAALPTALASPCGRSEIGTQTDSDQLEAMPLRSAGSAADVAGSPLQGPQAQRGPAQRPAALARTAGPESTPLAAEGGWRGDTAACEAGRASCGGSRHGSQGQRPGGIRTPLSQSAARSILGSSHHAVLLSPRARPSDYSQPVEFPPVTEEPRAAPPPNNWRRWPVVVCGAMGVGKTALLRRLRSDCQGQVFVCPSHTTRLPRDGEEAGWCQAQLRLDQRRGSTQSAAAGEDGAETPKESPPAPRQLSDDASPLFIAGEMDGPVVPPWPYIFVNETSFAQMRDSGGFLLHCKVRGHSYGTSKTLIEQIIGPPGEAMRYCILDVDLAAVDSLPSLSDGAHRGVRLVLISAPSLHEHEARLRQVGLVKKPPLSHEDIANALHLAKRGLMKAKDGYFDFHIENRDFDITYHQLKCFVLEGRCVPWEKAREELRHGELAEHKERQRNSATPTKGGSAGGERVGIPRGPPAETPRTKRLRRVTILVEPSFSGLSHHINRLRKEEPRVVFTVSHTTRPQKAGEVDGVNYHYVDHESFKCLFQDNAFLEFAEVGGEWFGTTKGEFEECSRVRRGGGPEPAVVIHVNVQGAISIKSVKVGARFVLLLPPCTPEGNVAWPTLVERWRLADPEITDSEIELRKSTIQNELELLREVPFLVDVKLPNNDREETYSALRSIILEGKKLQRSLSLLSDLDPDYILLPDTREKVRKVDRDTVDRVIHERSQQLLTKGVAMKADHFPSGKQKGLREEIDGAPNFRQVAIGPDTDNSGRKHTVFGVAQPTLDGARRVLMRLLRGLPNHTCVLWVNLREEPMMYIDGLPFCFKHLSDVFRNVEDPGITAAHLQRKEDRLRKEILREAVKHDGKFLVHDEEYQAGEFAAFGEVFAYWRRIRHDEQVMTVSQAFDRLREEGFNVHYVRLPITDEKPPKDTDVDTLLRELWSVHCDHPNAPVIFNCQLGRGRTTTATVLATLFLCPRWQLATTLPHADSGFYGNECDVTPYSPASEGDDAESPVGVGFHSIGVSACIPEAGNAPTPCSPAPAESPAVDHLIPTPQGARTSSTCDYSGGLADGGTIPLERSGRRASLIPPPLHVPDRDIMARNVSLESLGQQTPIDQSAKPGSSVEEQAATPDNPAVIAANELVRALGVDHRVTEHLWTVIDTCEHIQNLRDCVRRAVLDCRKPVKGRSKPLKQLLVKAQSYLRRTYFLVCYAIYLETQHGEDYCRFTGRVGNSPAGSPQAAVAAAAPALYCPSPGGSVSPHCIISESDGSPPRGGDSAGAPSERRAPIRAAAAAACSEARPLLRHLDPFPEEVVSSYDSYGSLQWASVMSPLASAAQLRPRHPCRVPFADWMISVGAWAKFDEIFPDGEKSFAPCEADEVGQSPVLPQISIM